jgi:hypothetical protein
MQPKSLCVRSMSEKFIDVFEEELKKINSIRYVRRKINGLHTVIIKCSNYYNAFTNENQKSFYGSYIYLYTNISIILSELIISFYETLLSERLIRAQYFYFNSKDREQILNITKSMLDPTFPLTSNKNMYLDRKEKLLCGLLKHFRKTNRLEIDAFVNFASGLYTVELEETINTSVDLFLLDKNYYDIITFILQNLLY